MQKTNTEQSVNMALPHRGYTPPQACTISNWTNWPLLKSSRSMAVDLETTRLQG